MLQTITAILIFAFPALVVVGGLRDATSFTIPNWISLALIALFLPAALIGGVTLPQMGVAALIGVFALFAAMGMFAMGWIGGGDAKLFAASALWLGFPGVVNFVLITGLAGGALALALLGLRSMWLRPIAERGPAWFSRLAKPGGDVPYGVAIAFGALAAFPDSLLGRVFPLGGLAG
ncbi:prepilin peptidase CpaA [Caulobacter ginsengisoli]|uniref:Prepilin peptidase CpaA n=1 Tax=Caulobacter ginsengisoli TaxID=400775 RepID=A0ABU0IZQ5_9CAUL|nr:prepilin peptidase [Caulobacter ginsengisoli]MDQ0466442.1 prepilin peptidase CpaA [Caulobacter ginsengisoli]